MAQTFQVLMMHPGCCRLGFLRLYAHSILLFICIHETLFIIVSEVFELFILLIL